MRRRFFEIDVFGRTALRGNPLAVVLGADDLSAKEMQSFATWTNFAETTFVMAPTDPAADYRARIFTTAAELPFAGHPTLGTARAWLEAGGTPRDEAVIVQECGVGLIDVHRRGATLAFGAPPLIRFGDVEPALLDTITAALGLAPHTVLDASWVDNGPGWIGLLLDSAATVRSVSLGDLTEWVGVVGLLGQDHDAAYEVRGFVPEGGAVIEDPVTGSLNASIAQWLVGKGLVEPPFRAIQGGCVGRDGVIEITTDEHGGLLVGGETYVVVDGFVIL